MVIILIITEEYITVMSLGVLVVRYGGWMKMNCVQCINRTISISSAVHPAENFDCNKYYVLRCP